MVDKETQQNKSSVTAVLFDWSGTISDDRRPVYEANKKMCDYWGVPAVESFEEWANGASMTPVGFFRDRGVTASGDEIYEVYRRCFKEVLNEGGFPTLIPGTLETLQRLSQANIALGIVSSHPQIYLEPEAREYGLFPLMKILHGDAQNKISAIMTVCQMMGLDRSRTIYIGDTIYDIRSAREAGLITAGVSTGYHTHEALQAEKPDHLFTRLSQVLTLVQV
ncbi:MAG: HAD family hydrolase [Candidatus Uhrbacteria bacterium]|nr:HAD family hydrolase [Candidatus Uhrbacteria bacterium]